MQKVGVVGVGQLPFVARNADRTFPALAYEATKKALDDAGLSVKDLDGVVYSSYCPLFLGQDQPDVYMQDYLGLQGIPSLRVSAGAATGGCAIYVAYNLIASGMHDIVLLLGMQKASDPFDFSSGSRYDGWRRTSMQSDMTWEKGAVAGGPAFTTTTACVIPHMHKYGTPTEEQVAKVSVKNHKNALTNPLAQLKLDLTVEDVLNSRLIAWPTTMFEMCLYSDGAAALILASEERARAIAKTPVWVSGVATSYYSLHRYAPADLGRMPGVAEAARRAYKQAGIKDPLNELDVVELQDLITGVEVIAYEELGLCPPGECGRLIDEGVVEKGGKVAVNPHGGCIACGHVAGVCDISSMCDVVLILQERAGGIQVPVRHGRGLVEAICGGASQSTVAIFEREG